MARTKKSAPISDAELQAAQEQVEQAETVEAKAAPTPEPVAEQRVSVRFPSQEGDLGSEDIFVGVNGVGYQIKREEIVSLPVEVLAAVDCAVISLFERNSRGEETIRNVKRFPYERV